MKQSTKSIQVEPQIHEQLKNYCDENGLKMQKLVEKLIINEIEKDNRNLQNNKSKR